MAPSEETKESRKRKDPPFTPQNDWELISQGAEARLWKIPPGSSSHNQGDPYIAKERFRKKYRHPILDERLTKQRCRTEGKLLEKCWAGGVAVPRVLRVEAPVLYIEYIDGSTVRNLLQQWLESSKASNDNKGSIKGTMQKAEQVGRNMGTMIGKIHQLGVVHGDLTTSNMIIRKTDSPLFTDADDNSDSIFMIDFGLAKVSKSEEDRAVDLYVLERALASSHPSLPDSFMDDIILPAYAKTASQAEKVLRRLEQVRLRGRKRECFG